MLLNPLPLSQTVTSSRTPLERDVLYGRAPKALKALTPCQNAQFH